MKILFIITVFCLPLVCLAARQEFGFYSELGCTGDKFILQSKQPNVTYALPIFSNSKSYSMAGVWALYKGVNYTNVMWNHGNNGDTTCSNGGSFAETQSLQYLGPPDTMTNSISLYTEQSMNGQEMTITGPAFANIPFRPRSIFSTGITAWTFYTGNNFEGVATCFIPPNPPTHGWYTWHPNIHSSLSNVGSILRGCTRRIDQYYYA